MSDDHDYGSDAKTSVVAMLNKHPEAIAWRTAQLNAYCVGRAFDHDAYREASRRTTEAMISIVRFGGNFASCTMDFANAGVTVKQSYTWQEFNGSALPDDTPQPKGSESWPQDALHGKIKDVLGDMKKVVPAARQALRQGIDVVDAGPQGRERSDQALGRVLRFSR